MCKSCRLVPSKLQVFFDFIEEGLHNLCEVVYIRTHLPVHTSLSKSHSCVQCKHSEPPCIVLPGQQDQNQVYLPSTWWAAHSPSLSQMLHSTSVSPIMSRTMKKEGEDFSNSPSGEEVEVALEDFGGFWLVEQNQFPLTDYCCFQLLLWRCDLTQTLSYPLNLLVIHSPSSIYTMYCGITHRCVSRP